MSLLKQGAPVASHVPQSLPSFAQTFNKSSAITSEPASRSPSMGAGQGQHISLPPIQHRSSDSGPTKSPRPLPPPSPAAALDDSKVAGRKRARAEAMSMDHRSPSRSNSPSPIKEESQADMRLEDSPSHANTLPPLPLKKRRVTVSGPALNTDVPRVGAGNDTNTPISPVVLGLSVQRDDSAAVEAVRSMMSVKQKQQAIIEQRRASVSAAHFPLDDRRHGHSSSRHPSPSHPSHSSNLPPPPVNASSLPPPSISFARRRADQLAQTGKRKPADILISPREAHTPEQLALSIQSAPPIPRPGMGGNPGRFPMMTLPRLPPVLKENEHARRPIAGKVPPTPTRLAAGAATARPIPSISQHHAPGPPPTRSPKAASVAIASTLVPPTPSSLQHPGYTGDRAGFLAPFEMFYDALSDSKQLKGWLSEQLQRSSALLQQQERMAEYVDSIVEKRMGGVRAEIAGLHKRIEELETQQLGYRRSSIAGSSSGKQPQRNGNPGPVPGESYQFPPLPNSAPRHSPMWERENPIERHAVSSSRLDPPKTRGSATHSPPIQMYHGESRERERGRAGPSLSRQHTSPRTREGGDTAMAPPPA